MPQALHARGLTAGALLITLTLTAALLTLTLLHPPVGRVDIGAPGDAYLAANFYQPELAGGTSFRWSGPNSYLQLPELVAEGAILSVRLHGSAVRQLVYLQLSKQATPFATLSTGEDWRVYEILIPPLAADKAPAALQLVTSLAQPGATDPRELGVALDWVRLQPLPALAALLPSARQSALFAWGLALIAAALWVARRAWAPADPEAARGLPTLTLLGVVAAALLWWAWRDPYTLGWLLPLRAGPLALATVTLAGLVWASHEGERGGWLRQLPRPEAIWPAALLALAHAALWSPLPAAWQGIAALAILWAPGWLLAWRLTAGEPDGAARLLLGVCGALGLQIVLLLGAALSPVGLAPWAILIACDLLALLGIALLWRAPGAPPPAQRQGPRLGVLLALVLVLAAGLRLPALGGAELHDDEASVFIAAAQLARGDEDALLTQLKGPAQVLLPAGPLALTGRLSELVARLPFALAGLGVVAGGFALARGLAGGSATAGVIAALVLALDGFMIAFSRIVQYQSVVVLLGMGAVWCAWRFAEGASRPRGLLTGAALLLAAALLGHYDAIFAAPALAWLTLAGGWRRGWRAAQWATHLVWPVLAGGALLASFYVPFVQHPHFAEVVAHLSERTGQTGDGWALYNNLAGTYRLLTFYNFAGLIFLLAVLLLGGLTAALVRAARLRWLGALMPLLAAAVCFDLARGPDRSLLLGSSPAALALWALAVAALVLAPATPTALRALLLWCGAAGTGTMFLIAQPRTHVYVFTVPLALLAGWCGAALIVWLRRPRAWPLRPPLAGGALVVALLALLHQGTLYVRQSPEYQRAFPATQAAPISIGAADVPIDVDARFGFPSRDGWKAIGELYRLGVLRGPYASNQSTEVVTWYLRGLRRCGAVPDYVFVALSAPNAPIPAGYTRFGSVQAAGRDQIAIYSRLRQGPPRVFALEEYVDAFDAEPVPQLPPADAVCGTPAPAPGVN